MSTTNKPITPSNIVLVFNIVLKRLSHLLLFVLLLLLSLMKPPLHSPSTFTTKHTSRNPTLIKQMINILQLKLISLREKEIYNRHPARTENGEDDKCPPADILHCDRGDLYDDEDAHPIYERAKCLAL